MQNEGTVKWYSESKGFGFIEDTSGRNIFVHYSSVYSANSDNSTRLSEGLQVRFELIETERGPEASQVMIDPAEDKNELDCSKNS